MASIIFDLDGTLVDSVPAICDIANEFLGELGLAPLDFAEARGYVGNGAAKFLERALKARPGGYEEAAFADHLARFQELYAAAPGGANTPFPGTGEALARLAAAGHLLGLCTNKPEVPTRVVVSAMGWEEYFGAIIAGDTLPESKPRPAPLLEAARRLGAEPVIYVGDSDVDAATARAARVPFALYTEGYRKSSVEDLAPTRAFAKFTELPGLVEDLVRG